MIPLELDRHSPQYRKILAFSQISHNGESLIIPSGFNPRTNSAYALCSQPKAAKSGRARLHDKAAKLAKVQKGDGQDASTPDMIDQGKLFIRAQDSCKASRS